MGIQEEDRARFTDAWDRELPDDAQSNFQNLPKRLRGAVQHSIVRGQGESNSPKLADRTIQRVEVTEVQSQYKRK